MHVYLPVLNNQSRLHTMFLTPAADVEILKGEPPSDWLNDDKTPRSFEVQFVDGKASVPESIGRYMIKRQLARATKLIIPGH